MKRTIAFWGIVLFCVQTINGATQDLERLYNTLDSVIANSAKYKHTAEKRIEKLRQQLSGSRDTKRKYELSMELYNENKSFANDSAISYISRCIELAEKLGDKDKINQSKLRLAYQCSSTGMYYEAVNILAEIDTVGMPREQLGEYYLTYVHVYGELGYYSKVEKLRKQYYAKQGEYSKLMFRTIDRNSDEYLQRKEVEFYASNDYVNALKINDKRLKICDESSRHFAIVAFYRYLDYKLKGDMQQGKYWLLKSAITDVQNAVMDQGSMWELANILLSEGDLQRSYRYINFAWECANNFSTRVRSWQVSPVLSSVDKLHQEETDNANRLLWASVVVISLLLVMLLALLIYVNRQRKKLATAHKELGKTNVKLSEAKEHLSEFLKQLQDTNGQLSDLNRQLAETNKVKEVYIGRFMQLCSQYVDKMDKMRKVVTKMVKNHEYEALLDMMRSSEFKEKELGELYSNFDKAFLNLFPNFVEEFNAMLKPEERVNCQQKGQELPTMVRIFALIRLGIEDSSKIAFFLHYSVNTIYNYRARVKNAALDDRGNFEARIKKIGMPE